MLEHIPETLAVGIVALISLVTKVSSIEVARQTSGDLDRELRAHGAASLIAAPFGGLVSGMQIGTSRLLEQAGAATRLSGVVCALTLGMVGLASFNLPGLIPIPIVAGLVFLLGYGFIVETLWRPFSQRAWFDLLLAVAIMIVCIGDGYLVGISVGLICACCLFAISYARIGVVRRHATRAHFASNVDRSLDAGRHLREVGDAIYIYWLSGYIFFGSSESVFERIRDDIEAQTSREVVFVILDFGMVSGVDSSAFVSLAKLRNFCDQRSVAIVYSSVSRIARPWSAAASSGTSGTRAATGLSLISILRSPGARTKCFALPVSTPIAGSPVSSRGCNVSSAKALNAPTSWRTLNVRTSRLRKLFIAKASPRTPSIWSPSASLP